MEEEPLSWWDQADVARHDQWEESVPYVGPDTSSQLVALRELERLAGEQDFESNRHWRPEVRPAYPDWAAPIARNDPPTIEAASAGQLPPTRRRKTEDDHGALTVLRRHAKRLTSFSLIGGFVFVAGLVFQVALVRFLRQGPDASYAWQAIFSIELSYLLNRYLTWKDQESGFWPALWKFNVQKLLMTVVNMAAYALLVYLGVEYLVANILLTAVFTPINYFASHLLVFVRSYRGKRRKGGQADSAQGVPAFPTARPMGLPEVLPSVSVIIPCKGNEQTINATVTALLGQDYPALKELILVGDVGDSTWTALRDIRDRRLILLEQEKTPGKRDPNVKRDKGIQYSTGEIIALADSDIVMDEDWLTRAVSLLTTQGSGMVAGGMRSIHDSFWGRFVDSNALAAKTPRLARPYRVTAENFGKRGFKPPITANAVFFRETYAHVPLDITWAYGYEDYEWMWRVAKSGRPVYFSGELSAAHHHRRSFRRLAQEYRRSAEGCARFIERHGDSPLACKRREQAIYLPLAAIAAASAGIGALAWGDWRAVLGITFAGLFAMSCREMVTSRRLEAAAYPFAAGVLGLVFTQSLVGSLLRPPPPPDAVDANYRAVRKRGSRDGFVISGKWGISVILCLQMALSLTLVWSNTAFSDEALYLWQGHAEWRHWLHGDPLPVLHASGAVQIYPVLGAVADKLGGLAGARILSMIFMLAASAMLYSIGKRLFGVVAALAGTALWSVSEPVLRLSFATIDPMACLLVIASFFIAVRSIDSERKAEWVVASGAALALASVTADSFAIMIPAVLSASFFVWRMSAGTKTAVWCASGQAVIAIGLTLGLMTALHMWQDVIGSTITRGGTGVGQGVSLVIRAAWSWDSLIFCIAVAGAIIALRTDKAWLLASLTISSILVPAYQAHLGTGFSMDKHVAAGTGLAALAAGYGISKLRPAVLISKYMAAGIASALLAIPAVTGIWYARSTFGNWPNASALVAAVSGFPHHLPVLISAPAGSPTINVDHFNYYLPSGDWVPDGPQEKEQVNAGRYEGIITAFNASSLRSAGLTASALLGKADIAEQVLALAGNTQLLQEIDASGRYVVADVIPYETTNSANSSGIYVVWRKAIPVPQRHAGAKGHKGRLNRKSG